jgi:hypothetical protein
MHHKKKKKKKMYKRNEVYNDSYFAVNINLFEKTNNNMTRNGSKKIDKCNTVRKKTSFLMRHMQNIITMCLPP